jgi:hypothetical protein
MMCWALGTNVYVEDVPGQHKRCPSTQPPTVAAQQLLSSNRVACAGCCPLCGTRRLRTTCSQELPVATCAAEGVPPCACHCTGCGAAARAVWPLNCSIAAAFRLYAAAGCQLDPSLRCSCVLLSSKCHLAVWHSVMYPAGLAVAHSGVYCPAVLRNVLTCAACRAVAPLQLMATVSFHDVSAARRCLQPLLPLLETAVSRIKDGAVCFGLRVRCLPMLPLQWGAQPGCRVQPLMMHPRALPHEGLASRWALGMASCA